MHLSQNLRGNLIAFAISIILPSTQIAMAQTTYPLRVGGYMMVSPQQAPTTFNAGFTFYSAAWPIAGDYPRNNFFQSGLYGTWMSPSNDRQSADPYQTIEGGLGWWYDRKFQTSAPKFSMGGVAFGGTGGSISNLSEWIFANSPGVGTVKGNGKYAIAQLSPSLLFPPDGLNLHQNTSGELFGYGYLALPLTQSKTTTAGQAIPTGNNSWTLFLNTENFKGPLAFFTPYYWSQVKLTFPQYANDLLDSRWTNPNTAMAMETPWSVVSRGSDVAPNSFVRSIPTYYPVDENGYSRLMHQISAYNQSALWDATASWLANTGPAPSGAFDPAGTHIQSASANPLTWSVRNSSNQLIGNLNWNNLVTSTSATPRDVGYQWHTQDLQVVPWGEGSLVRLPEYHQGPVGASSSSTWTPVSPSSIPAPAAAALAAANYNNSFTRSSHIIKDNDPVWTSPGPVAGPFRALLGDGSVVTYHWYRFADQPALLKADLSPAEREQLQSIGEKIHREWKHDRDYIAAPEAGKLASLDSGQIVSPPLGFEVGYVPIPWQQDWGGSVANPGSLRFTAIPTNPAAGQTFSVTVRADNASGNAQNVTSATFVQISLASGNGILGGNTSATIPSGQSSVTITGITYSASETITLRASATCLSPATSGNITYSAPSNQINLHSRPATTIGITQASLPATLKCPGTNANVTVFWGTANEGNRAADWQHSASLGSFNNLSNQVLSHDLTGLQPKTTYYYIFRATGSSGTVWSPPVKSFTTLPLAPVITSQPASAIRVIGSTTTLAVTATDAESYQWFKNGTPLSEGGTVSGATTATLAIANFSTTDAASYHVIVTNGSGTATSNAATLTAITPTTLTWDANTGTANAQDGGGNWIGGNNWLDGTTNVPWNDNHHAVIGTGGTGGTITPGNVMVNSLTINNFSGGTYTLGSGSIHLNGTFTYNATRNTKITATLTGPGSITKNGSGILTLDGVTPNTYSGGTTVNAGTLVLGTMVGGLSPDCSLAAGGGPVTLNSGAQINLNRVAIPNPLVLNGGTIRVVNGWGATWIGPVTVNANTTLTADYTYPFTIPGNVTGAGGLTKTGNHTLSLSGTNTYTGTTTVQAGRMAYQTAAAVSPGPIGISSTAVVELNFTGTRNVQSLTINGTAQTPGTYGSTGSTATNKSERFAGTGTLTVTVQCSIIYNGNGHSGGSAPVDAGSPYAANASVTVLGQGTLARPGFTFAGWNTAPNGTGTSRPPGSTFTITTNTTLYAQWNALPLVNAGTNQSIPATTSNPWKPAQLNPAAWYDAADMSTLWADTVGVTLATTTIAWWEDKSGNSRHLEATRSPSTGGDINGVHAIRAADGDYFSVAGFGTGTYDIFFVMRGNNSGNTGDVSLGGNTNHSYLGIATSGSTNNNILRINGTNEPAGAAILFNGETTQSVSTRGALYNKVGTQAFLVRFANIPVLTSPIKILEATNASWEFFGDAGEILFVASPAPEEAQKLEGYLAHKWNLAATLPVGHPYKTTPASTIATATLNGSATDPENNPLTYSWSLVTGPASVIFTNPSAATTTIHFTAIGTYTLRLTASDGFGSAWHELTITVESPASSFASWSATSQHPDVTFLGDANGDGVADGIAWLLGANSPDAQATAILPALQLDNGAFSVRFQYLVPAQRDNATLHIQHSTTLAHDSWTTVAIPPESGTSGGLQFTITPTANPDLLEVQITFPNAQTKFFLRLMGQTLD